MTVINESNKMGTSIASCETCPTSLDKEWQFTVPSVSAPQIPYISELLPPIAPLPLCKVTCFYLYKTLHHPYVSFPLDPIITFHCFAFHLPASLIHGQ
jgi:hypothetical protein